MPILNVFTSHTLTSTLRYQSTVNSQAFNDSMHSHHIISRLPRLLITIPLPLNTNQNLIFTIQTFSCTKKNSLFSQCNVHICVIINIIKTAKGESFFFLFHIVFDRKNKKHTKILIKLFTIIILNMKKNNNKFAKSLFSCIFTNERKRALETKQKN